MSGCDESPTTAPTTESQAIVGQIISHEFNIEVSVWQAQLIKGTIADSAGYFKIDDLPVGLYEVRLVTPGGKHLTIRNVSVETNRTTSLKEIRLSPPSWPLVSVYPGDSSLGVHPFLTRITITSTMPISMLSLETAVTFTPTIQGSWYSQSNYIIGPAYSSYYTYEFQVSSGLEVATEYTFYIGPGLTIAGGQAWGDSLVQVFTTDSLRLMGLQSQSYYGSGNKLVEPRRDFVMYAQFNAMVHPDSLTVATTFTPAIEGVWVADPYYQSGGQLRFFNTGDAGLRADQTYVMHINGDVPLVGSSTASGDLTATFRTQSLKVINSSPRPGEFDYCPGCAVRLQFNSEMDSLSLTAAFSLETLQGDPVTGTLSLNYSDQLYFSPDSGVVSEGVYIARVSTAAASLWGDHLKEPYELYFRVR